MKYMNKSIEELHELLKEEKVTSKELIAESLKLSHEVQEKYNAFVTILDDAKEEKVTDNPLSVLLRPKPSRDINSFCNRYNKLPRNRRESRSCRFGAIRLFW